MVPLRWKPHPSCLMTVRASTLSLHAGEVCFPGGRPEEGDESLYRTACREAEEELGIAGSIPLGELSNVPLYTSDYRLFPFVEHVEQRELRPAEAEVAEVLELSIPALFAMESFHAIHSNHETIEILCPIFEWDDYPIFGGTAFVLYELLAVVAKLTGKALPPLKTGKYAWSDLI